jgi:hypothetical protein
MTKIQLYTDKFTILNFFNAKETLESVTDNTLQYILMYTGIL